MNSKLMIETKNSKESFLSSRSSAYDADICGISKVYRLDKKTQEAQKSTELEDENEEAAEQDSEDSLENEPEDAEILDSEMEELKEDLGGNYNFI